MKLIGGKRAPRLRVFHSYFFVVPVFGAVAEPNACDSPRLRHLIVSYARTVAVTAIHT